MIRSSAGRNEGRPEVMVTRGQLGEVRGVVSLELVAQVVQERREARGVGDDELGDESVDDELADVFGRRSPLLARACLVRDSVYAEVKLRTQRTAEVIVTVLVSRSVRAS
jgi:hypothetical protein